MGDHPPHWSGNLPQRACICACACIYSMSYLLSTTSRSDAHTWTSDSLKGNVTYFVQYQSWSGALMTRNKWMTGVRNKWGGFSVKEIEVTYSCNDGGWFLLQLLTGQTHFCVMHKHTWSCLNAWDVQDLDPAGDKVRYNHQVWSTSRKKGRAKDRGWKEDEEEGFIYPNYYLIASFAHETMWQLIFQQVSRCCMFTADRASELRQAVRSCSGCIKWCLLLHYVSVPSELFESRLSVVQP